MLCAWFHAEENLLTGLGLHFSSLGVIDIWVSKQALGTKNLVPAPAPKCSCVLGHGSLLLSATSEPWHPHLKMRKVIMAPLLPGTAHVSCLDPCLTLGQALKVTWVAHSLLGRLIPPHVPITHLGYFQDQVLLPLLCLF